MLKRLLTLLLGTSALSACTTGPDWREGGLYATPNDEGTYAIVKILKVDEHGVHVRLYSNVFHSVPERVNESELYVAGMDRQPDEPLGMGHAPLSRRSFTEWRPIFIQQSTVSADELDGYEIWLDAAGGYF